MSIGMLIGVIIALISAPIILGIKVLPFSLAGVLVLGIVYLIKSHREKPTRRRNK